MKTNIKKTYHRFHRHYGAWWMRRWVIVENTQNPVVTIFEDADDGFGVTRETFPVSRDRAREINRGKDPFPGWKRQPSREPFAEEWTR